MTKEVDEMSAASRGSPTHPGFSPCQLSDEGRNL